MERVAVVGLSLQETDVLGLERLARPSPERAEVFARDLADELGASELVLLATCNRVEVVFAREAGHLPSAQDREAVATALSLPAHDELRQRMHLHTGRDAVRHLFRVASSLDSVVVGEDQILAQVRSAYQASERNGLTGRLLGALFEHAFQVGKQVRTDTELSRIPVSVVSLGLAEIARHVGGPAKTAPARVVLIGAGAMAELVVRGAREHGVEVAVVANRSVERARGLAALCSARAVTLEELWKLDERFDGLVAATSAPGYVVDRAHLLDLARRTPTGKPLVAVDLALPRDIEPCDDSAAQVVDLDTLRESAARNRALRSKAASQAEAIVERKLESFVDRAAQQALSAALAEVRGESESVFERELSQLFSGKLAHLGPDERGAIERWARVAFGRVTHVPIHAIKRMVQDRILFTDPNGANDTEPESRP
jgi:glutamyl-tRNA reductase